MHDIHFEGTCKFSWSQLSEGKNLASRYFVDFQAQTSQLKHAGIFYNIPFPAVF